MQTSLQRFMLAALTVVLLVPVQIALAEVKNSTKKEDPHASQRLGTQDFSNESLFTGDVAFTMPLLKLANVSVDLSYNSNVHKAITTKNKFSQSGWVGLGWTLELGHIEADINNTRDVSDDRYYFVSPGSSSELVWHSDSSFMLREYQYWKITRHVRNGDLVGWTVVKDDGTIYRFGNRDTAAHAFSFDFAPTYATRFSLGCGNLVMNDFSSTTPSKIAYQWDLSEIEDIRSMRTSFVYNQPESYFHGYQYTSESYPHYIIDRTGRKIEFVINSSPLLDFVGAFVGYGQIKYQGRSLTNIYLKDKTGQVVTGYALDYVTEDVLNRTSPINPKIFLRAIHKMDKQLHLADTTAFTYSGIGAALDTGDHNPGALNKISYPQGGSVQYHYTAQLVSNYDPEVTEGGRCSAPLGPMQVERNHWSLSGSDFIVVAGPVYFDVYRWKQNKWWKDESFPLYSSMDPNLWCWVNNDYVIMKTGTGLVVHKREGDFWLSQTVETDIDSLEVVGLGSNYFLYTINTVNNGGNPPLPSYGELKAATFLFNRMWSVSSVGTQFYVGWPQHFYCSSGFFACSYSGGGWNWNPTTSSWEQKITAWNGTFAGVGPDYVVTTSTSRADVYRWNGSSWNYQILTVPTNAGASVSCAANFFTILDPSSGNFRIVTYTGSGWVDTNGMTLLSSIYPDSKARVATGPDFVAVTWRANYPPPFRWSVGIIKYSNGQWCTGSVVRTHDTPNDGNWNLQECSPYISGSMLFTELYSPISFLRTHAYLEYNAGWSVQKVDSLNLGWSSGYQNPLRPFSQPGGSFVASAIDSNLQNLGDGRLVAYRKTYGLNFREVISNELAGGYDFPIQKKTVSDGMGNISETQYVFEHGAYDEQSNTAKYNKATVVHPGSNGTSVSYFYNGLAPGDCESFLNVPRHEQLEGVSYEETVPGVNTSVNTWSAVPIDSFSYGATSQTRLDPIATRDAGVDWQSNVGGALHEAINDGDVLDVSDYVFTDYSGDLLYETMSGYQGYFSGDGTTTITVEFRPRGTGTGRMASIVLWQGDGTLSYIAESRHVLPDGSPGFISCELSVSNSSIQYPSLLCVSVECWDDSLEVARIVAHVTSTVGVTSGAPAFHRRQLQKYVAHDGVETTTNYDYLSANGLINHTVEDVNVTTPSGSSMDRVTQVEYAFENHRTGMGPSGANMLIQPYEMRVFEKSASGDSTLISKKRTPYSASAPYEVVSSDIWDGSTYVSEQTVNARDGFGNVLESQDANGIKHTTKWGCDSQLPVAEFSNAGNSESKTLDFEDGTAGEWNGWTPYGSVSQDAHSGATGWALSAVEYQHLCVGFNASQINTSGKYTLSGWVKTTSTYPRLLWYVACSNYNGHPEYVGVFATGKGDWEYLESTLDLSGYSGITSIVAYVLNGYTGTTANCVWDDVRFAPAEASVVTTTYNASALLPTSSSDPAGLPTYTEYDRLFRPVRTLDFQKRSVSEAAYYLSAEAPSHSGLFSANDPNAIEQTHFVSANWAKNWSFEDDCFGANLVPNGWGASNTETDIVDGGYFGKKAVKIWYTSGDNSSIAQVVGYLKSGHTYTASVYFKASGAAISGMLFFGDADDSPYDNWGSASLAGNGNWQRLTVSRTMSCDDTMWVFLYGNRDGGHAGDYVIYDGVMVEEGSATSTPIVSSTYFNGLTADIQTQIRLGSDDIMGAKTYDVMHRPDRTYKPYQCSLGSASHTYDGSFLVHDTAYYHDSYPYGLATYCTDPTGRKRSDRFPGLTFQNESSPHFARYFYSYNLEGELTGYYGGTLRKTSTTDENGIIHQKFSDRLGNLAVSLEDSASLRLKTSFTYNILGQLCQTTDPRGLTSTNSYNLRGQQTQKVTPDAGTVQYLYDQKGNLRLIKDANHSGSWNTVSISGSGFSGTQTNPLTLSEPAVVRVSALRSGGGGGITVTIKTTNNITLLTVTPTTIEVPKLDSIALPKGTYSCVAVATGAPTSSYSVTSPQSYECIYRKYDKLDRLVEEGECVQTTSTSLFTQANARDASFPTGSASLVDKVVVYDTQSSDPLAASQHYLKGRISSATRYQRGVAVASTFYSYDELGRVEWIVDKNGDPYPKKTMYLYDAQGNILRKGIIDTHLDANNHYTWYEYDQAGRLVRVFSGQDSLSRIKEAEYSYLSGGMPLQLKLGPTPVQTVDYAYNSRDWTTKLAAGQFTELLDYTGSVLFSSAQYNGNISAMKWKTATLDSIGYAFGYDAASRLASASTYGYSGGSWPATNNYKMGLGYDAAGNIDTLWRYSGTAQVMDRLRYRYSANTNKLDYITDVVAAGVDAADVDNQSAGNYLYDANGNMQQDNSRTVSFVIHDMANMPVKEYLSGGTVISYVYDAQGQRVQKLVGSTPTYYALGADGKTESVTSTSGTVATYNVWAGGGMLGQVKRSGASLTRSYLLKDHLGSVRVTVGTTMIVDNFSGDLSQWTTVLGSGYAIENGLLSNSSAGSDNVMVNSSSTVIGDGVVSADVCQPTSTTAAPCLVVRYVDTGNYYLIYPCGGLMVIFKKSGGAYSNVAQASLPGGSITAGTWYHLQVNLSGANVTVYWNGQQAVSWTDPSNPFLSGKVGFREDISRHSHWENFIAIGTGTAAAPVLAYDDYYPFGQVMGGRSWNGGTADARYKYTEKERDSETGYDYFGARYYDGRVGRFLANDPHTSSYPQLSPYVYAADNPVVIIDPTGMDSVYFQDAARRPPDHGTPGTTYTANIFIVRNGQLIARFMNQGSTYANSTSPTDNTPRWNEVNEGLFSYNNASGHTPEGGETRQGLNLTDENGNRTSAIPGTAPDGTPANGDGMMSNVNVHTGASDNGGPESRGSHGCLTVNPDAGPAFFNHFDWTGAGGVTGNSTGKIFVVRGGGVDLPVQKMQPLDFRRSLSAQNQP